MFLESEIHGLSSIIFNYLISSNNTPQYPYSNYVIMWYRYDFQFLWDTVSTTMKTGPWLSPVGLVQSFLRQMFKALSPYALYIIQYIYIYLYNTIYIYIYLYSIIYYIYMHIYIIFTCLAAASLHPWARAKKYVYPIYSLLEWGRHPTPQKQGSRAPVAMWAAAMCFATRTVLSNAAENPRLVWQRNTRLGRRAMWWHETCQTQGCNQLWGCQPPSLVIKQLPSGKLT